MELIVTLESYSNANAPFSFIYYIYLTSANVPNVIKVAVFELVIYATFNVSWIKNTNADCRHMIAY
jgi:hypothetical protein